MRGDNLDELDEQAKAVAEVARTVPGIRDVRESLQIDYPEMRVETDREKAGLVGATAADAAQTTLDATLGNINTPGVWIDASNGQSYYVVTFYDGARVTDTQALARCPCASATTASPCSLGAYGNIHRSVGADRGRAQSPRSARRTCSCRPKGAISAPRRMRSRTRSGTTRERATFTSASSARSS